jgi:tRNA wybutosine-synthesizing protein 2
MYRVIRVIPEKGEEFREKAIIGGFLDPTRKIRTIKEGRFLEIPVTELAGESVEDCPVFEQENPEFIEKPGSLKEHLRDSFSEIELETLPSGWQILGDIIIINIPELLEDKKLEIAKALLWMHPKCRSVVNDSGIEGQLRKPKRELLVGSSTETIHKENGCRFKHDVRKVMYSKGNLKERQRMSGFGAGETVLDMFAGIGYFSIPMAVHSSPDRIIAIELNPEAFFYLKENMRLNRVDDIIVPICGDCSKLAPEGIADRVLMGYVGTTHLYLEQAIKALKKSGGILHYHETVPEKLSRIRPQDRVRKAASCLGRKTEILGTHNIKKYSPGVIHVVVDARIFE